MHTFKFAFEYINHLFTGLIYNLDSSVCLCVAPLSVEKERHTQLFPLVRGNCWKQYFSVCVLALLFVCLYVCVSWHITLHAPYVSGVSTGNKMTGLVVREETRERNP